MGRAAQGSVGSGRERTLGALRATRAMGGGCRSATAPRGERGDFGVGGHHRNELLGPHRGRRIGTGQRLPHGGVHHQRIVRRELLEVRALVDSLELADGQVVALADFLPGVAFVRRRSVVRLRPRSPSKWAKNSSLPTTRHRTSPSLTKTTRADRSPRAEDLERHAFVQTCRGVEHVPPSQIVLGVHAKRERHLGELIARAPRGRRRGSRPGICGSSAGTTTTGFSSARAATSVSLRDSEGGSRSTVPGRTDSSAAQRVQLEEPRFAGAPRAARSTRPNRRACVR